MTKKPNKRVKKIVTIVALLIVILWLISYTNVFRKIKVPLQFEGKPFMAYSFAESYTEGMRYIKINGQVGNGETGEYLLDLKEEKVLSLQENEQLHSSFFSERYVVSVYVDGQWEQLDDRTMIEQLIRIRDAHSEKPMIISFSDRLNNYKDFQIDFSILPDFRTTDIIDISFGAAGDLAKIYTKDSSYLLDMESQQIINPPYGFDEGKGFKLIANDRLALYEYRKVWNIEEGTILHLDYDKKYDNYGKRISEKGNYIYWHAGSIIAANTLTGKTQMIFDGELVAQPTFDMNDIKFISENEVGAVGITLRDWFEFGLLPGANNYYIMKYNFISHKINKIKLPVFAGKTRGVFAWSYDKPEVYFFYSGKDALYKMKI